MCKKCKAKSIGKMARRRKKSRVRGITSDVIATLTTAAMAAGGYYAANKVAGLSFVKDLNPYVKAGIKVVGGIGLTMIKGNPYTTPIGVGVASNGVLTALQEVKAIKAEDITIAGGIGQQRTWIAGVDSPALQQQPVAIFQ